MRLIAVPLIFLLAFSVFPMVFGEVPWLEDYSYRKLITVAGSAGAGTNYVIFVKCYYADGTDGIETLTGGYNGINATKIYLGGNVETDFDDVRFTDSDGSTKLDHFRDSYTASTNALFAVEIAEDLGTDQSIYIYFGDAGQLTASNAANTFRRVISSGVVLALPMNEGVGVTLNDYSGNTNTGTVDGATWVAGKFVSGLSFDGSNDKVSFVESASLKPANISCLSWFKHPDWTDATGYDRMIVRSNTYADVGNSFILQQQGVTDKLMFGVTLNGGAGSTNINGGTATTDNIWYQGIGSYDGTDLKLFINGASDAAPVNAVGTINAGAYNLALGHCQSQASTFMKAILECLIIFDYALSTNEISDLHSYYPQCSSTNLGSLYLRSFVNPEPQPSSVGSLEVNGRYATTSYVWMAVLLVIGFVFMGFILLRRQN